MIECIILAGGQGTRLRAVVPDLPKPMADIAGRPFLWWLLALLRQQCVRRIIFSTGYKSEKIQDYFGSSFNGMELLYAVEREPLGTGGALKEALKKVTGSHVLVLNGDTYTCVSLQRLLHKFTTARASLTIAVAYLNNRGRYGSVIIEEKTDVITGFSAKESQVAGYVNAGVYCLRGDMFTKYPAKGKFSFEREFLPKQLGVIRPLAFTEVRTFIDIGVPEDYALAQRLIPTLAAGISA
jgi:D-glycero-alpha-D-manno-heptose 1-phosphate guanylyltransferase